MRQKPPRGVSSHPSTWTCGSATTVSRERRSLRALIRTPAHDSLQAQCDAQSGTFHRSCSPVHSGACNARAGWYRPRASRSASRGPGERRPAAVTRIRCRARRECDESVPPRRHRADVARSRPSRNRCRRQAHTRLLWGTIRRRRGARPRDVLVGRPPGPGDRCGGGGTLAPSGAGPQQVATGSLRRVHETGAASERCPIERVHGPAGG